MSDSTHPPASVGPGDIAHHRTLDDDAVQPVVFPAIAGGAPAPEGRGRQSALIRGGADEAKPPTWGRAGESAVSGFRFPRFAEPKPRSSRFNKPRFDGNADLNRPGQSSAPAPAPPTGRMDASRRDPYRAPHPEPGRSQAPPSPATPSDTPAVDTRPRDEELRAALEAQAADLTRRELAVAEKEREIDAATADFEERFAGKIEELQDAIEHVVALRQERAIQTREARQLVVELAMQVAEVLVGESIAADPEQVEGLARRALEPFHADAEVDDIVVRTSPRTHEALTIAGATEIDLPAGSVKVIRDETLSGMGVVVESPRLVVEGRVEQRLGEVRRALLEEIGQLPDDEDEGEAR